MQALPHYFYKMDGAFGPEDSTISCIRCWLSYIIQSVLIPIILQTDMVISQSEARNASLGHYPMDHTNENRECVLINFEDDMNVGGKASSQDNRI